jgi:hypothetical protein
MRFAVALVCSALFALTACGGGGVKLGKMASPIQQQSQSKKKDCAACEKMCKVAGESEKNAGGVEDCIKDCKKDCS